MRRSVAATALSGKNDRGGRCRQKRRFLAAIGGFSAAESHVGRAAMSQKKFSGGTSGAVDDGCRTAAAGILIAWKGLADGGRVHLWGPTFRSPPNRFINREAQ